MSQLRLSLLLVALLLTSNPALAEPHPGTKLLKLEGDITSQLVDGVDRFLLRQLAGSIDKRAAHWKRNLSSPEAYVKSVAANRARLAEITGVVDKRAMAEDIDAIQVIVKDGNPFVAVGGKFTVTNIRWRSLRNMHGEGLMLKPIIPVPPTSLVIVIPDADQTPEMLCGLSGDLPPEQQYARRLVESGCRGFVPSIISRHYEAVQGRAKMTSREFAYRSAYELGRHLIGYEIQKILSLLDEVERKFPESESNLAVMGWGEGGLLALYAAALDERIDVACVSGYFDSRQDIWQEPISRNVFGLLEQFGDAEIATLVAPRKLIVEAAAGPQVNLPSEGGAPAVLDTPRPGVVKSELARAAALLGDKPELANFQLVSSGDGTGPFASEEALEALLSSLDPELKLAEVSDFPLQKPGGVVVDDRARQVRQLAEIDEHNQWLLRESPFVRKQYMSKLDTSSLEAYEKSVEPYRDYFRHEVIGHFDLDLLPMNPRTRMTEETEKWTRYEVVLDVFEDVIAYGLITIPKGIKQGEQRPVVVCQHGLEGRPQDTIGKQSAQYYSAFATVLAERGFITFAPQNLYIFKDRFRTLQRKSYVLKKTLFSTIVPQHQQIVNWLKGLSYVDGDRIAFYGLSYGGKSAMRIPPLVTDYCLSICSADFNEWVLKNASTRHNFSYMWHGEYEIFEWNLGSTFNYAEMAYLICPRPFMVERGHFDGVGEDEWVGYEFGKVRYMYQGKLKIGERTEIEWFDGPHTINAVGTYKFLHKHLNWPEP